MTEGWHVHAAGDPALPPLLCLHGFLGNGGDFAGLVAGLTDRFRLLAPDLPGHGRSRLPGSVCTMEGCAAALVSWLDREVGRKALLYGYSMGGRLALYLALRYPGRFAAVVLESASPGLADAGARAARRQHDEALARRLEREGTAAFVATWYAQPLFDSLRSAPGFAELLARRQQQPAAGLAASLRGMGTGSQPSLWSELARLSLPLSVIVGENDAKFRDIALKMMTYQSAIDVHVVPGAGHNVHLEQAEAFTARLRTCLQAGVTADS